MIFTKMSKSTTFKGEPRKVNIAPDFELTDVNGSSIALTGILDKGYRVILVFLRHLG